MRRKAAMLVGALWLGTARIVAAQPDNGAAVDAPVADLAPVPGEDADTALVAGQAADDGRPAVQAVGDGQQKLYVVHHGGTWSMHVEAMMTDELVRLWKEVGGPQFVAKTVLDRPYNISVHKMPPERIVETLLDGFDFTLHYDADGRLERVRVYSLDPASASTFRTPRLVESLGRWREVETAAPSADAAPAPASAEPSVP